MPAKRKHKPSAALRAEASNLVSIPQDRRWRVTGPDFVADLIEYDGEITGTAPKLHWALKGRFRFFVRECSRLGWKLELVEDRK